MSVKGKDPTGRVRIQCSAQAGSGTCPDPHTFYLDVVEDLVLDTLRAELKNPRRLATYVEAYNDARQEYARSNAISRTRLERRIAALVAALDRLVDFIAQGVGSSDRIRREMGYKEAELSTLKAELASEPMPIDLVVLHPSAVQRCEKQLGHLREELEEDLASGNTKAAEVMRELIESVVVSRNPQTGKGINIKIKGKLRSLLGASLPRSALGERW
jgi:site-specific DNA recombinase